MIGQGGVQEGCRGRMKRSGGRRRKSGRAAISAWQRQHVKSALGFMTCPGWGGWRVGWGGGSRENKKGNGNSRKIQRQTRKCCINKQYAKILHSAVQRREILYLFSRLPHDKVDLSIYICPFICMALSINPSFGLLTNFFYIIEWILINRCIQVY